MKHTPNCRVYRPAGFPDCTGNGITAKYDTLTVVTDVPYLMTEFDGKKYLDRPDEEAVMEYAGAKGLDPRRVLILCDRFENPIYTPYLKPLDAVWGVRGGQKLTGPCAGGNYVETGRDILVRVHDRYDTQEDWDGLSK